MLSSTLSPKIHRYSMLPSRCMKPPCMNIEVNTVTGGETTARSVGRDSRPSSTAGITPSE